MALGSYETALGWLGSENRKSSIRVFFDYNPLCTSKLDFTDVCSSLEARLSSESATQADRLDQQADRLGQQQAHFTDVCSALDGKLSETTRALDSKLEAFMREGTA